MILSKRGLPLHTVLASCHPKGFIGDLRNCGCPPQPEADPPLAENTDGSASGGDSRLTRISHHQ